jgi:hypothetical protein
MTTRKILIALGAITVALGSPLTSMADIIWINTNDEAGTRIVITDDGPAATRIAPVATRALRVGDLSPERQYIFTGEEGGWQLRPMEYRYEGGRLVHVDDPVGHMERVADTRPLTELERAALDRSGGG